MVNNLPLDISFLLQELQDIQKFQRKIQILLNTAISCIYTNRAIEKIIFIYVAHLNTKFIMCFDKVNVGDSGGEYNWKNA